MGDVALMVYTVKYKYAVVDGLRIRYLDVGSGYPLILIHGLGGSIEAWHSTITALSDNYRVIALDLRGFGRSQKPPNSVSIGDLARDVVGIMDYTGVHRACLLGFSMGGLVALETYRSYPERIDCLILASTSPRLRVDAENIRRALSTPSNAYQSLKRLTYKLSDSKTLKLLAEALASNDPEYMTAVADAVSRVDYWGLLPKIKVPVLILVGELDPLVPLETARRMANIIPDARLEVIRGAGHLSKFDDSKAFNLAVARFLDSITGRL